MFLGWVIDRWWVCTRVREEEVDQKIIGWAVPSKNSKTHSFFH